MTCKRFLSTSGKYKVRSMENGVLYDSLIYWPSKLFPSLLLFENMIDLGHFTNYIQSYFGIVFLQG